MSTFLPIDQSVPSFHSSLLRGNALTSLTSTNPDRQCSRRGFLSRGLLATATILSARPDRDTNLLAAAEPTSKHVPWLDEIQTPPTVQTDNERPLATLLVDDQGKRITTVADWEPDRKSTRLNSSHT